MDELIVFLIRETGWSFEYTVQFVKGTPLSKLNAFIDELKYQKALDEYKFKWPFGMMISVWATANSRNRKYTPDNFIGYPPQRKSYKLEEAANKAGIILPKEGGLS